MSRLPPAVMALLIVLPALALVTGPAGGQITPELTYISIRDYGVDANNNTLLDSLAIEIVVDITQAGPYTVVAELSVEVSGTEIAICSTFKDVNLTQGSNAVTLAFPSEPIYRKGLSGVFKVGIETHKFDYTFPWLITHSTRFYDHRTFEAEENPPPVPPDAPRVEFDVDYINVSTEVFQVFVNRTSPEVIYRYRESRPNLPDFLVTFYRLVFFKDDGDGYYDGEEALGSVVLTNYPWAFLNVEVSGPKVSFDLRAHVPITYSGGFSAATVTITCTVTNGTVINGGSFVQGASELKMDLNIDMDEEGIPQADHVALEARTRDSLANHGFLVEEPTGFRLYPRTNETGYLPVPRVPMAQHTKVSLVDELLVEHAFVGWVRTGHVTYEGDPTVHTVDVGSSFRVAGGKLELLFTYPYAVDTDIISHDPSVGILEENLPPKPPDEEPPEESVPNLYLYLFAIIVGAVVLVLSVYARAQGY